MSNACNVFEKSVSSLGHLVEMRANFSASQGNPIRQDGYGSTSSDVHIDNRMLVSSAQIKRFKLRTGDYIVGQTQPQDSESYHALPC